MGNFLLLSFFILNPVQGVNQYNGTVYWDTPKIYAINSVDISDDGKYVAVATSEGLNLLDSTGAVIWTRSDKKFNTIWSVAISPDGNYLAMGSTDENVYFYNKAGNLLWKYQTGILGFSQEDVVGVDISADGRYVAIGTDQRAVSLFSKQGSQIWTYSTDQRIAIDGVAISPDGKYVAASTDLYNTVYFLDSGGHLLWKNHYSADDGFAQGRGVAITRDGTKIIVGSTDKHVYCFDKYGKLIWKTDMSTHIGPVAVSDDGSFIVAGSEDKNLYLLDGNGNILWYFPTVDTVDGVAITGDGSRIAGLVKDRDAFVISNPDYIPQLTSRSTAESSPANPTTSESNTTGLFFANLSLIIGACIIAIILIALNASRKSRQNEKSLDSQIQPEEKPGIRNPELNKATHGSIGDSRGTEPDYAEDYPPEDSETPIIYNIDRRTPVRGAYAGRCPRCGSAMVWRQARKTGELYRGCTAYHRGCRYQERSY